MKKILILILTSLGLVTMSSCVNEVDDEFNKSATERLDEKLVECQNLLTSATNGWIIQYYPSAQQAFGGTTFTAKFDSNGNVTVAGESADKINKAYTTTVTSHFSINSSSSVVLTFDTYNELIHYWSDPDIWGTNYLEGDFEFAYVSGDAKQLIFRGIKTENKIVFTALDNDIVSYIESVADVKSQMLKSPFSGFQWEDGSGIQDNVIYDIGGEYNILSTDPQGINAIPFCYTADGVSFYRPVTINGTTAKNFKWETDKFVATDAVNAAGEGVSLELTGFYCENYISYDKFLGNYTLSYAGGNVPVTLSEDVNGQSYILSGFGSLGLDLKVGYSKIDTSLSLNAQYLTQLMGLDILFVAWNADYGDLVYDEAVGMKLVSNGDLDNLVLTFEDNGVWGTYPVNSFVLYAYGLGTLEQYARMKTMTKL